MSGEPAAPLGALEVDALQEVATIGCGHALTQLGKLMHRRLDMDVPEAWVGRAPGAIADFLGGLGQDIVAVSVRLEGLLEGWLVLALPEKDAERLAAALGYPVPEEGGWDDLAESAVMESGNIVGSAFVSAIANMMHGKLLLSIPTFARGGGREVLDALVNRDAGRVALATRFSCHAPTPIEGLVLVMPDPARIRALLESLRRKG